MGTTGLLSPSWLETSSVDRFAFWLLPFLVVLAGGGEWALGHLRYGPLLRAHVSTGLVEWVMEMYYFRGKNLTMENKTMCLRVLGWCLATWHPLVIQMAAAWYQLWWHLIPLKTSPAGNNIHLSEAFKIVLALCSTAQFIFCVNKLQLGIPIGSPKTREQS